MTGKYQERLEELKRKYGGGQQEASAPSPSPASNGGGIQAKMFQRLGLAAPGATATPKTPAIPPAPPVAPDVQAFDENPSLVVDMPALPKYEAPKYLSEKTAQAAKDAGSTSAEGFRQWQQASEMPVGDRYKLAADIGKGRVKVTDLTPEQVPWDQLLGQPMYGQIGAVGMKDPQKAYGLLVEMQGKLQGTPAERQGILPPSFGTGLAEGTSEALSFGATQMAPGRTTAEKAGQFVGQVAGMIPGVMAAGATGGAAVAGVAAKAIPALAGKSLLARAAQGALQMGATGLQYQAMREAAEGAARPEEFNLGQSAKDVASTGGNYALFGALMPYSGAILGGISKGIRSGVPGGKAVMGALESAAKKAPEVAKVVEGGVEGAVTGGLYGGVVGTYQAVTDPEVRDAQAFFRSVAQNAKEEFSEEVVEAVTLMIARRFIPGSPSVALQAARELQAMPENATPSDYEAAMERIRQQWEQEKGQENAALVAKGPERAAQPAPAQPLPKTNPQVEAISRVEQDRNTLAQVFGDRPDLQAVLTHKAASAPIVGVSPKGLPLRPSVTQLSALEQFVAESDGLYTIENEQLRFHGNVAGSAKPSTPAPVQATQPAPAPQPAKPVASRPAPSQGSAPPSLFEGPVQDVLAKKAQSASLVGLEPFQLQVLEVFIQGNPEFAIEGDNLVYKGVQAPVAPQQEAPAPTPPVDEKTPPVASQTQEEASSPQGKSWTNQGLTYTVRNQRADGNWMVTVTDAQGKATPKVYSDKTVRAKLGLPEVAKPAKETAPEPEALQVDLEGAEVGKPILSSEVKKGKPKSFGETVKVGDKVAVEGREGEFTVVDAKDPSMLRVKNANGAELPIGRAKVQPLPSQPANPTQSVEETPSTSKVETPQTPPIETPKGEVEEKSLNDSLRTKIEGEDPITLGSLLRTEETGAIMFPTKSIAPTTAEAAEVDKAISWRKPKTLRQHLTSIPQYVDTAKRWLVDHWFDDKAAVQRYQRARFGKGEVPAEMDAQLRLELLPRMVPGHVNARLEESKAVLRPLGDKIGDYFRYTASKTALHRAQEFGYSWDTDDLPMTKDKAQALVDQIENGPDAQLFKDVFAAEQRLFADALQDLVDAEVLSPKAMQDMLAKHQVYEPWYRDMSATEDAEGGEAEAKEGNPLAGMGRAVVNVPKGVNKQTGSKRKLMDPMERRVIYFSRLQSIALRNKVGVALTKFADTFDTNQDPLKRGVFKVAPPMEYVETPSLMKEVTLSDGTKTMRPSDIMRQLEDLGFDPSDLTDPHATLEFFRPRWAPKDQNIVTVYRDGKPTYYKFNEKGLLEAVASMDPITTNFVANALQKANEVWRTGVTVTPGFSVANLIRDTFDSFRLSKNQAVPGQALFEAIRLATTKDPFVARVVRDGLKQNGWIGPEIASKNIMREVIDPRREAMSMRQVWNLYLSARDNAEFATRLGEAHLEYRRRLNQGLKKLPAAQQQIVRDALAKRQPIPETALQQYPELRGMEAEAYLRGLREGGRITLNFTRGGKTTKQVNRYLGFFKIPFEAAMREYEAATEQPLTWATKTVFPALAIGVALVLANKDDEDYMEASDFERDKYMLVSLKPVGGKGFVRIPKPNGMGGLILNLTERTMRQWMTDDPDAFRDFSKTMMGELFPRVQNPVMELIVAGATGYSMNGERDIVPQRLRGLSESAPELQYDSRTSPTVRNALAPVLGKIPGGQKLRSPMVTQYLIDTVIPGYSDGFFMLENYIKKGAQAGNAEEFVKGTSTEELPVVGRFYSRPGDGKMGRSVGLVYDEREKAEGVYNKVRALLAEQSRQRVTMDELTPRQKALLPAVLQDLTEAERTLYARRKFLDRMGDHLTSLNNELRALESDSDIKPGEQKRRIEELRRRMTTVANNVVKALESKGN